MSWYTVDREVEAAGYRGVTECEGRCGNPPRRTLRVTLEEMRIGAYQLCDECADRCRGGTIVAFGSDMKGQYLR